MKINICIKTKNKSTLPFLFHLNYQSYFETKELLIKYHLLFNHCYFKPYFNKEILNMKKILFVCHGNICRSPMAEFVFKKMVQDSGYSTDFEIHSAATSSEELGNPMHYGTQEILKKNKIPFDMHCSTKFMKKDYLYYDYLIGMDLANIRNMIHISGGDSDHKIKKLLSFTNENHDVADPWYTHNFEDTYADICIGCKAFLSSLSI